jgi:CRP-like cAMP-binding protein
LGRSACLSGRPIGDWLATDTWNGCLVHDPVEPAAVLGAVGLLRYCSARHLARIGALVAPLEVSAATVVVAAGARDVPLVLVLGGVARAEGHDGDAFRIGPGGHVGADTLLDGGPAAWAVTAVTPMRLGVIERRNFLELLVAAPMIARRVLVAARQDPHSAGGSSGGDVA